MEQNISKYGNGTIIAAKARDEFIKYGKTNIKCPKCGHIPKIDIQGSNKSHIHIKCKCGFVKLYTKGI